MGLWRIIAIIILFGCGVAAAKVPLPRPRPPAIVEPISVHTAAADFDLGTVTADPTACDQRLAGVAASEPLPRLIGPGACGGADMVELDAVLLPDGVRVAVEPAAVLNCTMAEALSGWLREDAAPALARLGSPLRAVENYDSYECRPRNRVAGAKLSDHAHGDAIDVRAFHLADGRRLALTDADVDKLLRETLRESACRRFTTVLGPGSDGYHDGHVHVDLIQRHNGYRICEWNVRTPALVASTPAAGAPVPLPPPRPVIAAAR